MIEYEIIQIKLKMKGVLYMEIRFIVELVLENLRNCKSNCVKCPNKKLKEFIEKIGVDEFERMYNEERLPEDIAELFRAKAQSITL